MMSEELRAEFVTALPTDKIFRRIYNDIQQRITAGETPSLQSLFYYICLLCNGLDAPFENVFYVGGRGRLFSLSLLVLLVDPRQ